MTAYTTMRPQRVLSRPRSRATMNWGMSRTMPGTIIVKRSAREEHAPARELEAREGEAQHRCQRHREGRAEDGHHEAVEEVAREVAARPGTHEVVQRRCLRDELRRDLQHVRVRLEGRADHEGEGRDHHQREADDRGIHERAAQARLTPTHHHGWPCVRARRSSKQADERHDARHEEGQGGGVGEVEAAAEGLLPGVRQGDLGAVEGSADDAGGGDDIT